MNYETKIRSFLISSCFNDDLGSSINDVKYYGSISPISYAHLLCVQILKEQKIQSSHQSFFALLGSECIKASCWWNWPQNTHPGVMEWVFWRLSSDGITKFLELKNCYKYQNFNLYDVIYGRPLIYNCDRAIWQNKKFKNIFS